MKFVGPWKSLYRSLSFSLFLSLSLTHTHTHSQTHTLALTCARALTLTNARAHLRAHLHAHIQKMNYKHSCTDARSLRYLVTYLSRSSVPCYLTFSEARTLSRIFPLRCLSIFCPPSLASIVNHRLCALFLRCRSHRRRRRPTATPRPSRFNPFARNSFHSRFISVTQWTCHLFSPPPALFSPFFDALNAIYALRQFAVAVRVFPTTLPFSSYVIAVTSTDLWIIVSVWRSHVHHETIQELNTTTRV